MAITDIFDRYPEFRGKAAQMALMCRVLCERGLSDDALALGQAAVAAAPHSTSICAAVAAALSAGVARFHVPMLLDDARNRAYARAIERMVRPGMKVLEIGTGAGLLAMLCARAGAQVVTCEGNPMIAAAAEQIIADNSLSDRITLVRKFSTDMSVPVDLPEPADLVIHEIFGSALFNEGVDSALTDARRRLLKPGALSLPPRAHVRCALVRMARPSLPCRLNDVEGFDLSRFELLDKRVFRYGRSTIAGSELVSEPVSGLSMNYDQPAPFGVMSETIEVRSLGGRIDAVVQWIAIDFGNGDILENNPFVEGPASSWGPFYTDLAKPIDTRPGDMLHLTLCHRKAVLTIDVTAAHLP